MGALHARVIATGLRTELAFVCDPNRTIGEEVASRYGALWTAEFESSSVDAVVVAAPTEQHHVLALNAIDAGLPLLVEKPLADDVTQVEEMLAASAKADVPMMCGFLERFNPAVRTALEIAQGPLHLQVSRHSPYVPRIRTGVASDLLIHDVDLAIRLFGSPPVSVVSRFGHFHETSEPDAEDVVDALLGFSEGAVAALSASRLSHRKVRTMTITEIDRQIEIDLLRQSITIYRHVAHPGSFDDPDGPGYSQQTIIDIPVIRHQGEPLVHQLEHFVDLIEGRVDAEDERRRILPPHRVVDAVRSAALTS